MEIFNRIRGVFRLIRVAGFTFKYLMITLRHVRKGGTIAQGLEIRRRWSAGFTNIINAKVDWEGSYPEDETCLFVGNHRCHFDPQIVMGRVKAFPVSRAEVRNWPLIGKGSAATGIIFVDKSSRESRQKTKTLLLEEMKKGNSVLIFPEGHTNVKPLTATFQKGSFDQAAAGGFKVVPYTIEYKDKRDYWDHSDSFAVHFIKRFGKRRTYIKIVFGPSLHSDNAWTLLRGAQHWIDETIIRVRAEWGDVIINDELRMKN
jgi:1-acyl-sn-glycerol-3-phosphate acyltransferase